jgi:PTS system cellobiose-specific IIA component
MQEDNKLLSVAMEIILHSGDSRNFIQEAIKAAKTFNFDESYSCLDQARKEIVLAHQSQTSVVQNEARGERYEYSLLFNHAQDTLMTVMSELNTSKALIEFAELLNNKIENRK